MTALPGYAGSRLNAGLFNDWFETPETFNAPVYVDDEECLEGL